MRAFDTSKANPLVVLRVAGSNPVFHPCPSLYKIRTWVSLCAQVQNLQSPGLSQACLFQNLTETKQIVQ